MKHERSCAICGNTYAFCPDCRAFDHLPRWMSLFCSENCLGIYNIENDYRAGVIDATEAKTRLLECDLSNKDHFADGVKLITTQIFDEAKPKFVKKKREKVLDSDTE